MLPGLAPSLGRPRLLVNTFANYPTGSAPADWTSRYGTGFTPSIEIVAGSISGKALRWTKTGAARQGLSWDRVPNVADVEILLRMRAIEAGASSENFIGAYARGSGASGAETGYRSISSCQTTNTLWISGMTRYVAGTLTVLGTNTNGPSPNYTVNTWAYLRFRCVGASLQRKMWYSGVSEPVSWDDSQTDANITAAGWIGMQQASANPDVEIDYFAVSLGGASPLTIPVPV